MALGGIMRLPSVRVRNSAGGARAQAGASRRAGCTAVQSFSGAHRRDGLERLHRVRGVGLGLLAPPRARRGEDAKARSLAEDRGEVGVVANLDTGFQTLWQRLESLLPNRSENCDGDMCELDLEDEKEGPSVVGGALLIAGTALGGGMLAVPVATAKAGFAPSLAVMLAAWVFLTAQALLLAEVNLSVSSFLQRRSASWWSIASVTMGRSFGMIVALAYFVFSNTVIIAQVTKGGSILSGLFPAIPYVPAMVVTAAMGASIIYLGSSKSVDMTNRTLTYLLGASFVGLITCGLPAADPTRLVRANWTAAVQPAPVLLDVLNFSFLVPVVCTYMDGNREKIRKAILAGSVVPVAVVAMWVALSTALVPFGGAGPGLDPVDALIAGGAGGGMVAGLVAAFSMCAVYTTLVGGLLSLHEFWEEALRGAGADSPTCDVGDAYTHRWWDRADVRELAARAVSLLPGLGLSLVSSGDLFYKVMTFSGAYLVTFLFGISPVLMVAQTRKLRGMASHWRGPRSQAMLPGGVPSLVVLFVGMTGVIGLSLAGDLPKLAAAAVSLAAVLAKGGVVGPMVASMA